MASRAAQLSEVRALSAVEEPGAGAELPAFVEWPRMQASGKDGGLFLPTAWRACAELPAHGRPFDAEQVAFAALSIARQRSAQAATTSALRDLSIALNNVGRIASAHGDGLQAEAVYRESLGLSRELVERLGGTPEALDDLAVSLLNVADLPPGDAAMRNEASRIYATLASRFPDQRRFAERLVALRGDNPDSAKTPSAST